MGKYVKIIKFGVGGFGDLYYEDEIEGVDKFSELMDEEELEYYREQRGGKIKDNIEKIIEYIDGEDIEEGEEVDMVGDECVLLLGIKKENYDVNNWLKENWFGCEEEIDVY